MNSKDVAPHSFNCPYSKGIPEDIQALLKIFRNNNEVLSSSVATTPQENYHNRKFLPMTDQQAYLMNNEDIKMSLWVPVSFRRRDEPMKALSLAGSMALLVARLTVQFTQQLTFSFHLFFSPPFISRA